MLFSYIQLLLAQIGYSQSSPENIKARFKAFNALSNIKRQHRIKISSYKDLILRLFIEEVARGWFLALGM